MRFLSDNYLNFLTQDTFYVDSKMGFELLRSWFGQRTYHKDSYMTNRLGGWEGRYRRTESPSTAAKRNSGKEIMCQNSTKNSLANDPSNPGYQPRRSLNNTFSRISITSDQQKKMRRHKEMNRHQHILTGKKIPPDILPRPCNTMHISSSSLMELPGATKQEDINCNIPLATVLQSSQSTINLNLNQSIPSSSEDYILERLLSSTSDKIPPQVTKDENKNMKRHSSLWCGKSLESLEKIEEPTSTAPLADHQSSNDKWEDHKSIDFEEYASFDNNIENHQKKKLSSCSDTYLSHASNTIDSGLSGISSMSNISSSSRAESCKISLRSGSILSTDNSTNSTLSSKGSSLSSHKSFSTTDNGPLESFSQVTGRYNVEEYADSGNGTLQNTNRHFHEEIELTSPNTRDRADYIENLKDELNQEKENRKLNPTLLTTKLTELEKQKYCDNFGHQTFLEPSVKEEDITKPIKYKLEVLREEEKATRRKISSNEEVGQLISKCLQDSNCLPKHMDKFMLHLKESENIIKLLLNISGRLAKYENDLSSQNGNTLETSQHEKMEYKMKMRQKLSIQLEDCKKLKQTLDQRTETLSGVIRQYVNEETNELFLNYLKVKSQLSAELKETLDKISLVENQIMAIGDVREIREND